MTSFKCVKFKVVLNDHPHRCSARLQVVSARLLRSGYAVTNPSAKRVCYLHLVDMAFFLHY